MRGGRPARRLDDEGACIPIMVVAQKVDPLPRVDASHADWLERCLLGLSIAGCVVVEGVLGDDLLARTRAAMYSVQAHIQEEVGTERLERAGEIGVLRLMLKFDPVFVEFLEIPEVLSVVDAT